MSSLTRMLVVGLVALLGAGWASAPAAQAARFQAVPIDTGADYGTEKALIVDTVAGHLWIWVESPAVNEQPGGRYVIYQGQLEPGQSMGQIMQKQEWGGRPSADE